MHPAMLYWWKSRQRGADFGAWTGCGPAASSFAREWRASAGRHGDVGAGAFGVRRPLRFLAFKLDLDDAQVAELAKILDELKTERAQADVDGRRTTSAFADAVGGETFDEGRAAEGAQLRVGSAERLRDAVVKALRRIHALLEPEQREQLAYLIRTGTISL
ncbi:MAG: Spy/CpxP family protein refolding chaperone [Candidatus Binatia bacterium]